MPATSLTPKWVVPALFAMFTTIISKLILQQMSARKFPTAEYIQGFARVKGVPDMGRSQAYFSTAEEAIQRCADNPFCVGVSAQRLFMLPEGTAKPLKRGATVFTVHGQPGEGHAYVKDLYPTIFR